jgi:hypothetical protein
MFAQSTTPTWTATYNGSCNSNDYGRAVTTDGSSVYVTGEANTPGSCDRYIETVKYSNTGAVVWSRTVNVGNNTGTCDLESGFDIAVDGSGNVWVAGDTYQGTTYWSDFTLIKYNSSGTLQTNYPKTYHDANYCTTVGNNTTPSAICLAISGTNVYVGGSTTTGTTPNWKFIVLKDDPSSANWGWSNTPYTYQGSATANECRCTDIKVNPVNTYVYATGWISNATTNGKDVFTVGIDPSTGLAVSGSGWPQIYSDSHNLDDVGNAISIEPTTEDVFVAGYRTKSTTNNDLDGLLIKYNSRGTQQWVKTYDNSGYADSWTDIETRSGASGTPVVFVGGYLTKGTNTDYALAAYDDAGNLATGTGYWPVAEPVSYNGAFSGAEAAGTDKGYGIEYSATTNRIYITGSADEGTSTTHSVCITTLGYDATTGSAGTPAWKAIYDESSDAVSGGIDENFWKYGLKINYNGCYAIDFIYVEGATKLTHSGNTNFDYVTLVYGSSGVCSGAPSGGRLMNTNNQPENMAVELHPNPFTTTAELRLAPGTQITNAVLSIYDVTGRAVASVPITSATAIIDRGTLQNGLYFFTLTENGNILSNGKFIIAD